MRIRCYTWACLLAIGIGPWTASGAMPGHPVFEITTTHQAYNARQPWQKESPGTRLAYGVLVASNQVLTTESAVRNAVFIQLRREQSDRRIPATVVQADPEVNLALLQLEPVDDPFPAAVDIVTQSVDLATEDLRIIQFDETRAIQRGRGSFVKTLVGVLDEAPFPTLLLKVSVDLDVHADGAPVLMGDKLLGIVQSYDRGARTAMLLPYPTLRRFLDDVETPPYRGFASAGFNWKPLVDPAKRRYLKADTVDGGVSVLISLDRPGITNVLASQDVIVEWDGYAIDAMGYYKDPEFGRLLMSHLIKGRRRPGERVPVRILRDGKPLEVDVMLSRFSDEHAYIPEDIVQSPRDYLVEGGMVMQEMTGRWLRAGGRNWRMRTDARLVHMYLTRKLEPPEPGARVVLLSGVLPHAINIGYEHLNHQIIEAVNGTSIRNLDDVFNVRDRDGHITRLTLRGFGTDIVLDSERLAEANATIEKRYNLSSGQRRGEQ